MAKPGAPRLTTRRAVALGCLIAVLGPVGLLAWGLTSFFNAAQPAWVVAWSPDSQEVAAGYGGYGVSDIPGPPQDDSVRIWAIANPATPRAVLTRHTSRVLAVVFSPDGRRLATGDEWGVTLLWDTQDLQRRPIVMDDDTYPDTGSQQLAFSPDGRWLAGGGGSSMELGVWDLTDPLAPAHAVIAPGLYIAHAGFLADNQRIVAITDEGRVGVWDRKAAPAKPALLPRDLGDGSGVQAIALSKDGRWIAGAGEEGIVWLWDLRHPDAAPARLPGTLPPRPTALAFDPAGARLVAGAQDDTGRGATRVWDLANPSAEPAEVRDATSEITDLAFSPDGQWLAASGRDGAVRLWPAADLSKSPRVLGR
jgi:WD40 repeat protein